MMSNLTGLGPKMTTEHQARLAYVYIRQSSLSQVTRHAESTDLQYHLVERAIQLGWPRDRVKMIDEDLGKSGASAQDRPGFQRLMTEIGLGRVGLVVSLEASRLARNNSDWYQLLELCSIFDTLIADSEGVYNPRLYADRLALGLSGIMSEAELHHLRLRLQAGARNKAERGALHLPLPVGLVRLKSGEVQWNPDEEVQARIRLVLQKFRELRTAKAVVRYLLREELLLPCRPLKGPAPHEVIWQPARTSMVLQILKNPAYAGAYVYGRTTRDPARRTPGRPQTGIVRLPVDRWPVLIHNVYPAYISWEEFLSNLAQLESNQSRYKEDKPGVPRKGQALLQGIVICGRCGARMRLRYSGPHGEFPVYQCDYDQQEQGGPRCQEVRALGLDAEIERLVLEALAPDQISLALAALEQLEQQNQALRRHWALRLERVQYEAERARRQYTAVEPENRLVARTLERQWEEKLRAVETAEQEYQTWLKQGQLELTPSDRQAIVALGQDLPKLWEALTTTPSDRKHILRLVVQEVMVDQHRERGKVWFQINWQTGAISEGWYKRRVHSYAEYADVEAVRDRLWHLHAEQKMDKEMAEILNKEGFRSARGQLFNVNTIWLLRHQWKIPATKAHGPVPGRWEDGSYSVQEAAGTLGVFPGTIYKWLRTGRLPGSQLAKGLPWKVFLNQEQIVAWREYIKTKRKCSLLRKNRL